MKASIRSKPIIFVITIMGLLLLSAIPALANVARTNPAETMAPGDAIVNVAHFAPFNANSSVTVKVDDVDTLTGVEFGDIEAGL